MTLEFHSEVKMGVGSILWLDTWDIFYAVLRTVAGFNEGMCFG